MLQPIIGGKYVEKYYNHVKYIERVVQPNHSISGKK